MADNVFYISAGIVPNDTGEAENSNEFFMASGLVPDDADGGPPPETSIPVFMNHYRNLRAA